MAPLTLCLLTHQFFFRVHITTSLDIILYFLPLDWKLDKDRDKAYKFSIHPYIPIF